MGKKEIESFEIEIDREFNKSKMLSLDYSQAMWTILSVLEDYHIRSYINQIPFDKIALYTDTLINAITHPIRSIYLNCKMLNSKRVNKSYNDNDYGWAQHWIEDAIKYNHFCSIFPLWHRKKIKLNVKGTYLDASNWNKSNFDYEAYNRFYPKSYKDYKLNEHPELPNDIVNQILKRTKSSENSFDVKFNPKLVRNLYLHYSKVLEYRYFLPDNWSLTEFNFGDFKKVYIVIQSLLQARFIARSILISKGLKELGFQSSVWVIKSDELSTRICRYSSLSKTLVIKIINFLTLGNEGIRNPDVVHQPIVDLKNGYVALSPFIWMNSNVERNFCVLLNQIPAEKSIYSKLINGKEILLREDIIKALEGSDYETTYGELMQTDLDLAIIDRNHKVCLCLELKWFIEPAEIRETINRSKDLKKGVVQIRTITDMFLNKNDKLLNEILKIDSSFRFYGCVASLNWIGHNDVQDSKIPIIKIWHLIDKLKKTSNIHKVIDWLDNREYLPSEGKDYQIQPIDLQLGKLSTNWYGIKII